MFQYLDSFISRDMCIYSSCGSWEVVNEIFGDLSFLMCISLLTFQSWKHHMCTVGWANSSIFWSSSSSSKFDAALILVSSSNLRNMQPSASKILEIWQILYFFWGNSEEFWGISRKSSKILKNQVEYSPRPHLILKFEKQTNLVLEKPQNSRTRATILVRNCPP